MFTLGWEREGGREKGVQQDFFFISQSNLVITWVIPDFNDLSNKCMLTQSLLILHFQDDICRAPWRPQHCWPLVPSWLLGLVCPAPDFLRIRTLFSVQHYRGTVEVGFLVSVSWEKLSGSKLEFRNTFTLFLHLKIQNCMYISLKIWLGILSLWISHGLCLD